MILNLATRFIFFCNLDEPRFPPLYSLLLFIFYFLLYVALCRWTATHHKTEALVIVRRAGGEVRLVSWRRRPLHPLPPAHAGDGAWEEGLRQRMPQPRLAQLVATNHERMSLSPMSPRPWNSYPKCCSVDGLWNNSRKRSRRQRERLPSCPVPDILPYSLICLC